MPESNEEKKVYPGRRMLRVSRYIKCGNYDHILSTPFKSHIYVAIVCSPQSLAHISSYILFPKKKHKNVAT